MNAMFLIKLVVCLKIYNRSFSRIKINNITLNVNEILIL